MALQLAQFITTTNSAPRRGRMYLAAGRRGGRRTRTHPWHSDNIGPPNGRRQATEMTKAEGEPSHPLSAWGLNADEVPRT
jgi:hypothetical protein